MSDRLPTYAISHGGGPWPWIKDLMPVDWEPLESALAAIPDEIGTIPRAILMVSAHWETPSLRVQTNPQPGMLYDYGGFPDFTYRIQYPSPGSPEVAARVLELLSDAGIEAGDDSERGYDHGMFAPMQVIRPQADIPVLQLSILRHYDPEVHLGIGRALAPLRDEGVLIVGSGFPSFHDLSSMGPPSAASARAFDAWLTETMVDHVGDDRSDRLRAWDRAPSARVAHPREDHLVPLFVAVGAAEGDAGSRHYHEDEGMGGWLASSGYRLG